MKTCPYCGETIHDTAKKCIFCGKELKQENAEPAIIKNRQDDSDIPDVESTPTQLDKIRDFIVERKGLLVGCIAIVLLLLGVLLIRNCSQGSSSAYEYVDDGQDYTELLRLPNPKWSHFVRLTKNGVRIHKQPGEDGIFLMKQWKYYNSDEYYWSNEQSKAEWATAEAEFSENEIFPLVGESGEYYKVVAIASSGESFVKGYIRKDCCEIVEPAPITEELLTELGRGRCSYMIVNEGKYKGLCFQYSYPDLEGYDMLSLGVRASEYCLLFDGTVGCGTIFEESYHGAPYIKTEHNLNGYLDKDVTFLAYGPENRGDDPQWESRDSYKMLNVKSLTSSVIKDLYERFSPAPKGYITICYYFPQVSKTKVHNYMVESEKFEKWLKESNIADAEENNDKAKEVSSVGSGDLPLFDLHGPVKSVKMNTMFCGEAEYGFDRKGALVTVDGDPLNEWIPEVSYNRDGIINNMRIGTTLYQMDYRDGRLHEMYTSRSASSSLFAYVYNGKGEVILIKERDAEAGEANNPDLPFDQQSVSILNSDSYGNWTERKISPPRIGEPEIETRTITYYE